MLIIDYELNNITNVLNATIQCKKCGKIYYLATNKLSKCFFGVCPHCGNIDIDRQASGEVPGSIIKELIQIDQFNSNNIDYTVEGKSIKQFLKDTYYEDRVGQIIPADFHIAGIYRLKNIYSQAKVKKKLDLNSFPDFETFMRWSVKNGYRDWKTLQPDSNSRFSVASKWVELSVGSKSLQQKPTAQLGKIIDNTLEDLRKFMSLLNSRTGENYDTVAARTSTARIIAMLSTEKANLTK